MKRYKLDIKSSALEYRDIYIFGFIGNIVKSVSAVELAQAYLPCSNVLFDYSTDKHIKGQRAVDMICAAFNALPGVDTEQSPANSQADIIYKWDVILRYNNCNFPLQIKTNKLLAQRAFEDYDCEVRIGGLEIDIPAQPVFIWLWYEVENCDFLLDVFGDWLDIEITDDIRAAMKNELAMLFVRSETRYKILLNYKVAWKNFFDLERLANGYLRLLAEAEAKLVEFNFKASLEGNVIYTILAEKVRAKVEELKLHIDENTQNSIKIKQKLFIIIEKAKILGVDVKESGIAQDFRVCEANYFKRVKNGRGRLGLKAL